MNEITSKSLILIQYVRDFLRLISALLIRNI